MRRGLFGDNGYGLDSLGTEVSVQKTAPSDLKAFHASLVVPNNCVLAIYGDIKPASVRSAVTKALSSWKRNEAVAASLSVKHSDIATVKRIEEMRDKKQAVLVVGFAGTTLKSEDRYALELVQEACSDLGSRLFLRVREKLGLAYYVGAQNFVGLAPGYFAFYTGTEPAKAELVEKELLKEAELLRTEGLTREELDRAKAKVIGQKKIARQDLGGLAMTTALDELYGLGYAHIDAEDAKFEAVSLEQVKAVSNKYLRSDALVVSVMKPGKA
jgi:zinc protease